MKSTRRGFLRGSIGVTVATSCARETVGGEVAKGPAAPEPAALHNVRLSTTVNGKARSLDVDADDTALEVIRNAMGLTGGKHGCGHGACGACTMQLDGTPVATCVLPATSLEGRQVTTVEGIASRKTLHPVQRAFMAEDGLQCGYCTPGFIVEAAAFHDKWRKQHGKKEPSRDAIADALSGHLCRCGAYDSIYRAVEGACTGRFDGGDPKSYPRYDAREKVTGEARYTVDIQLPGMLHAVALYSPHAHARVKSIDTKKALEHKGVKAVIDLLGTGQMVRFAGQEVLALAAVDDRTAREGLALIEVEYEVFPAIASMEAAKKPDARPVFEKGRARRDPPNASEGPLLPEKWKGNVRGPMKIFSKAAGKAERAVEQAADKGYSLAKGRYTTQVQCHTVLEPHSAVAHWTAADELTVYLSTQAVSHMANDIAEKWELKRDKVQVIAQYVGAGFGSKGTLQTEAVIAVELAKEAGAPVRYARTRRAELVSGGNRPGTETEIAVAVSKGGELEGVTVKTYSSSGAAVGHVTSLLHRIIYPDAPKALEDYDVLTNAGPGMPFRGPGGPQAYWSLESAIDEVAAMRGEDPLKLRHKWDPNPARQPLYTWAEDLDVWKHRRQPNADRGRFKRGVGVALGAWFAFTEPKSRIQLDSGRDGLVASTGAQDMGNGTRTVIAEAIAREFGLEPRDVIVRIGHSKYVHGPMSAGSRTVSSLLPPCAHAADQLKEELVDVARKTYRLEGAVAGRAGVEHAGGVIPWMDVIKKAPPISVVGRRRKDKGGYFLPPLYGLAIEKYISASIQLVEVEVDTRLGRVRATQAWGGLGVGQIVSPTLARSQAQGGILQALSYALYEERRLDPHDAFLLTGGLEDYRIMGIGDIPKLHIHFHERGYDKVREGSVGLGEIVTLAPPAALGNAVFNATGWRPRDLPIRPDRVLQGVRA